MRTTKVFLYWNGFVLFLPDSGLLCSVLLEFAEFSAQFALLGRRLRTGLKRKFDKKVSSKTVCILYDCIHRINLSTFFTITRKYEAPQSCSSPLKPDITTKAILRKRKRWPRNNKERRLICRQNFYRSKKGKKFVLCLNGTALKKIIFLRLTCDWELTMEEARELRTELCVVLWSLSELCVVLWSLSPSSPSSSSYGIGWCAITSDTLSWLRHLQNNFFSKWKIV